MTVFDYAVMIAMAVSVLLGAWRGVVSEILALAAWVVAFFVTRAEAPLAARWLAGQIAEPGMRLAVAYLVIFVGVLLLFGIARMLLSRLLSAVGLGLMDRLLGAFFGVLRGVLVVMAGVMVAGMTTLPRETWWQEAVLAPPLETAVLAVKPWLPAEAVKRIRF